MNSGIDSLGNIFIFLVMIAFTMYSNYHYNEIRDRISRVENRLHNEREERVDQNESSLKIQRELRERIDQLEIRLEVQNELRTQINSLEKRLELHNELRAQIDKLGSRLEVSESELEKAKEKLNQERKHASLCQSGYEDAPTIWPNHIPWPVVRQITFHPPFQSTPAITYGIRMLDSDDKTNVRAMTELLNPSASGFSIKMYTYANTKQWGMGVSWMACPSQWLE